MHFHLCGKHDSPGEGGCPFCAMDSLEEELSDWREGAKTVLEGNRPHDEIHCTCVPPLRARILELETLASSAVAQLMYGTAGKEEALNLLRTALGR